VTGGSGSEYSTYSELADEVIAMWKEAVSHER
jgi:hypothetical protein